MKIKALKRNFILLIMALTLMNFFMNCSGFEGSSSSSSDPASLISSKSELQHYAIQSSEQLARSLSSVTNIDFNSTIINEYNARKPLMSTDYTLGSVTAPMLISISNLSSQFCNELVKKEVALTANTRSYFLNTDFNKGLNDLTDQQFSLEIDMLSLKFWGRSVTDEERLILNETKREFVLAIPEASRNSNTQTRNLMLSTCTVMLSSFDFITL